MIAQLIDIGGSDPHKRLAWMCPGCKCGHQVPVPPHPQAWEWNGSLENPTVTPSILITYGDHTPPDRVAVCHSFVREGRIQFLGDCTHEFAGYTVPLPKFD